MKELRTLDVTGTPYIVGCKSDLDANVHEDEILSFATAQNAVYMQTSAK